MVSLDWFWSLGRYTGDSEERVERRLVDRQEERQLELLREEK